VNGGPQEKRRERPKKPTLWAVSSTGLRLMQASSAARCGGMVAVL